MNSKLQAHYEVLHVTEHVVLIADLDDGTKSITNDAERVVAEIERGVNAKYPGRRIIYRDTEGRWDELKHDAGRFTHFSPLSPADQQMVGRIAGAASQ